LRPHTLPSEQSESDTQPSAQMRLLLPSASGTQWLSTHSSSAVHGQP
jgi:hypothetical protein